MNVVRRQSVAKVTWAPTNIRRVHAQTEVDPSFIKGGSKEDRNETNGILAIAVVGLVLSLPFAGHRKPRPLRRFRRRSSRAPTTLSQRIIITTATTRTAIMGITMGITTMAVTGKW